MENKRENLVRWLVTHYHDNYGSRYDEQAVKLMLDSAYTALNWYAEMSLNLDSEFSIIESEVKSQLMKGN